MGDSIKMHAREGNVRIDIIRITTRERVLYRETRKKVEHDDEEGTLQVCVYNN